LACVFDDDRFEAEGFSIEGGEAHAEVVGQPADEEALQAALAEVACESGCGGVVVFEEGRVGVDLAAKAFSQDQFGLGDV
jgi:hypothetical protein